jgi:hypothetical protein
MGASAGIVNMVGDLSSGISGMAGASAQARAIETQGAYQKTMFELNTKFAQLQADDAIRRGDAEVAAHKGQVKKLIGSQRAAMAAQGIEIDSGSAMDVQSDTAMLGELDAMKIKTNAYREAYGYKVEAMNNTMQGELAASAAKNAARNTRVTGGLQAVNGVMNAIGSYSKYAGGKSDSGGKE